MSLHLPLLVPALIEVIETLSQGALPAWLTSSYERRASLSSHLVSLSLLYPALYYSISKSLAVGTAFTVLTCESVHSPGISRGLARPFSLEDLSGGPSLAVAQILMSPPERRVSGVMFVSSLLHWPSRMPENICYFLICCLDAPSPSESGKMCE